MKIKKPQDKRPLRVAALLFSALLCSFAASVAAYQLVPVSYLSDEIIAREQVFKCRNSDAEDKKEVCYQKNMPVLMDKGLSLERAFAVLARVLELDPRYQSCHVLAHELSGKEVAKDPEKWKDVLTRVPLGICGSGALHGAFQERFRVESMPDASAQTLGAMLDGACDPRGSWNPSLLDRSSCMHGMGHLFLYVTAADVKKSVALCDALGKRPDMDFSQTCTEGVFMQAYQPLEPDDKNLIHKIKDALAQPKAYCAQFTGIAFDSCVKESWPAVQNGASDPAAFQGICMQLKTAAEQDYCARGLMYPVIEVLHYDQPKIEAFCGGLTNPAFRNICWARLASKYVWANNSNIAPALAVCNAAPAEAKDDCWSELVYYGTYGLPKNSATAKSLCAGMPEPYRSQCTDGSMKM